MDTNVDTRNREKITSEVERAIRHINKNLYTWKGKKAGRTNFSITYSEVYGVTKNWLIRCLRSVVDYRTADTIFRKGYLNIIVNEEEVCIEKISLDYHQTYSNCYYIAQMMKEIFNSLNYKGLKYNPNDYTFDDEPVGEFYYPRPILPTFVVNDYDSLMPKN